MVEEIPNMFYGMKSTRRGSGLFPDPMAGLLLFEAPAGARGPGVVFLFIQGYTL